VHLGRCNKIANDAEKAARRNQILEQVQLSTDLTDLEQKSTEGVSSYDLLLSEFDPVAPLRDRIIQNGENMGNVSKKQKWKWSEYALLDMLHQTIRTLTHYTKL